VINKIKTRDEKDNYLINNAFHHKMELIISNDNDLLCESNHALPIKSIQEIYKEFIYIN
jgi:predicted nucleic acid-binding protein